MTPSLAFGRLLSLAQSDDKTRYLHQFSRYFGHDPSTMPSAVIILLVSTALLVVAYYLYTLRRRTAGYVGSRALLRLAGDRLGLSPAQRRLLWRLGRAADFEPAAALVSPQLLSHLLHRGEQAGLRLTPDENLLIGQVLDTVAAASNA